MWVSEWALGRIWELTALGRPVVPELKLRKPQTLRLSVLAGILYGGGAGSDLPCSMSCWIFLKPGAVPSRRKT